MREPLASSIEKRTVKQVNFLRAAESSTSQPAARPDIEHAEWSSNFRRE